ncbi:ARM repeat-containing protein [Aureobasidium pullulans]|uniref:ARM repeat-containing protein n=1 Tax=Aureobasidium pullulans TaxID=5580 RepID=A0A4T0AKG5_AURPU|nr:ARM repeat-containing protein [Aureobasidium pullulans]THX58063.1 ARM repeat-containing protein [Aureobasidium pullulans]THX88944.1 ARM repeat-containing protein [Aureobasidium pullulans]TIA21579.1 ARM repeat-containing protein [Aureobasidium pullulans]
MAPSTRPEHKINLDNLPQVNYQSRSASSTTANSPNEVPSGSGLRYPLGNSLASSGAIGLVNRSGAGSPSKEYGSRLFSKRAREIQAQEGVSPQIWGPPTSGSGHSTPLRETIPESPSSDSFPDFDQSATDLSSAPAAGRRMRAGTVPSRFPPVGTLGSQSSQPSLLPKTSRPTPSTSPLQASIGTPPDSSTATASAINPSQKFLLSRLRAGSMPQRPALLNNTPGGFGPPYFSNGWTSGRERASTLQSIRSSDAPSSPAHSSRDSFNDNDVKTLDYLGLVDTPQPGRPHHSNMIGAGQTGIPGPTIADLAALNAYNRNANRFRSYSVNAKEKYADDEEDDYDAYSSMYGGIPSSADITAAQALAVQEAVRQHNLEVQAFTNLASASRPRARTAGVLDSPSSRLLRNYIPTPSRLDNSMTASDFQEHEGLDYSGLTDAVQQMHLDQKPMLDLSDDNLLENPTRALWLGNIPPSTTVSSLNVIFGNFGPIESTRVLTHKSCGFVNFETLESAVQAKSQLNNKEIFPGAGPIRIGYAKVPSNTVTPGAPGSFHSPSPDQFARDNPVGNAGDSSGLKPININAETAAAALLTPNLRDMRSEIYNIIQELGANKEELVRINANVEQAISYDLYHPEIPGVPEPSPNRVHDAPRLREIRKRIDNNSCSPAEIENIAMDMLPEIAELASDYLGNTVVQKLFEYCSEPVKEAMLREIAPHLAEIGVHKNGTWAAQKIIDVAKTPTQVNLIVDALRPYTLALFLDQYGNYVIQCCLRFQAPGNDFIFDAMLQRLWEVAQGRFGARAMRACLESHFASRDQQRMLASAIALHSVQLATNTNGALLLTWFLDTCTFPRRRSVLAPRLIPHLVHLCTHKVAYLTVLKIINQRSEADAREAVLRALFFSPNDAILQDVLSDSACGATFIFKVLTTPFLDEKMRPDVLENVRNVLLRLKAQPQQGYKRLMDEVGLSTRHGGASASRDASQTRSSSRGPGANGHMAHLDNQGAYGRQPYGGMAPPQQLEHMMGPSLQRTASIDSNAFDPYGNNGLMTPAYTHSPAMSNISPVTPQQMQYQQAMLAQQHAAAQRPGGYYPPMNGFGSPGPQMMDPYGRGSLNASPIAAPGAHAVQNGYAPPGFNPNVGMGGYQYPVGYYPPQQGQVGGGGQRRGRR